MFAAIHGTYAPTTRIPVIRVEIDDRGQIVEGWPYPTDAINVFRSDGVGIMFEVVVVEWLELPCLALIAAARAK